MSGPLKESCAHRFRDFSAGYTTVFNVLYCLVLFFSGNKQCSASTASDRRGDQNTAESKRPQTGASSTASDNGRFFARLFVSFVFTSIPACSLFDHSITYPRRLTEGNLWVALCSNWTRGITGTPLSCQRLDRRLKWETAKKCGHCGHVNLTMGFLTILSGGSVNQCPTLKLEVRLFIFADAKESFRCWF